MKKENWKSIRSIPRKGKPILVEMYANGYHYKVYSIPKSEKWKDVVSKMKITRWSYIEDLVPPMNYDDFCPHLDYCKNACPCICDEHCIYEPKI